MASKNSFEKEQNFYSRPQRELPVSSTTEILWASEIDPKYPGTRGVSGDYERKVFHLLNKQATWGSAHRNAWFEYSFKDSEGDAQTRCCSPDSVFVHKDFVCVAEAKTLSNVTAEHQLCWLYWPVLKQIYPDRPFLLLEIFKRPAVKTPEYLTDISEVPFTALPEALTYRRLWFR